MILTCPACATSYVVKDGAIPPAGRQVRCASCKHSWHQAGDGEALAPAIDETPATPTDTAPPEPADVPIAQSQEPVTAPAEIVDDPLASDTVADDIPYDSAEPIEPADAEALSTIDVRPTAETEPLVASDEGYDWEHGGNAAPAPRRGRGLIVVLALIAIVGALAAAAWFLAPPEWLSRAGLAQDNAGSPLKLMVTSQDRQKLASGNDLVSLSGRVINPTDATQSVPPLQADLRNGAGKLVYSWTIAPPAASLPPRASASFNAAELGVPADATSLTLRWAS